MQLLRLAILITVLSSGRNEIIPEGRCDLIELNHFYDAKGAYIYDQVIFWKLDVPTGKFHVSSWCLADRNMVYDIPEKTASGWIVRHLNQKGKRINIKAPMFRESWTQIDPEREDKKFLREDLRIDILNSYPRMKIPETLEN